MTSFQIYKSTFRFTIMRIISGLIGIVLIVTLPMLAFVLSSRASDPVRICICSGAFLVACILVGLLSHFVGYTFRAGQIAAAANAIATGRLSENAYAEGKAAVKKRFGTVAVFFAIERIINTIVHQVTNGVTKVADRLGNKSNNSSVKTIGSIISLVINAMLKFMCSCCMGWIFIHPDENAWRCACDGAILYFKNWKDLLKNTAKVIGFGFLSLVIIGGMFFGVSHLVLHNQPAAVAMSTALEEFFNDEENVQEIAADAQSDEESDIIALMADLSADEWRLLFEGLIALILWGIVHSALVDPYIMISVMDRYLKAGLANPPGRDADDKLMVLSKGYKKAISKSAA